MHNKALQTIDSASICTNDRKKNFYNDVDETLGKSNHYTIVMGDFNAQIGKRTNPTETATGKFWLELINERGDTLVEWATSRNKSRRKQGGDGRGKAQTVQRTPKVIIHPNKQA